MRRSISYMKFLFVIVQLGVAELYCYVNKSSDVGAGNAGNAAASPNKKFFGQNLVGIGRNWGKLRWNLDKIEAKFGQIWLDLGKIKIFRLQNFRSLTAMNKEAKMHFANCEETLVVVLFTIYWKYLFLNWKFETLFYRWGWDCF